jgi:hypothetical protein
MLQIFVEARAQHDGVPAAVVAGTGLELGCYGTPAGSFPIVGWMAIAVADPGSRAMASARDPWGAQRHDNVTWR